MLRVLRWVVWLGLILVFVRGVAAMVLPAAAPASPAAPAEAAPAEPEGLRAFPVLFATEYLTWTPGDDSGRAQRLRPYLASHLDSQAGWAMDSAGRAQKVLGAWPYSVQQVTDTRWVVTVAARVQVEPPPAEQADRPPAERMLFLGVPVALTPTGWVVYDYPTLLPPPPPGAMTEPLFFGQTFSDGTGRVQALLNGFFRAYTAGGDVTYYLLPGTPPPGHLAGFALESLGEVTLVRVEPDVWALVTVILTDPATGARLTSRYTLQLVDRDGRWYIKDILPKGV